MAIVLIVAARITLGSGVTSTTNAPRAPRATRTRRARRPRAAPTRKKAAGTLGAPMRPATAVRCERPLSRIASSRSDATARVSPTARPGRSPAPGSGSRSARSRKVRRTSAATAKIPGAGARSSASSPKSTSAARSPASPARTLPRTRSRVPGSGSMVASTSSGTPMRRGAEMDAGTEAGFAPVASRAETRLLSASSHRRPSLPRVLEDVTVASTSTRCPSWSPRRIRTGSAAAGVAAMAATTASATATSPGDSRLGAGPGGDGDTGDDGGAEGSGTPGRRATAEAPERVRGVGAQDGAGVFHARRCRPCRLPTTPRQQARARAPTGSAVPGTRTQSKAVAQAISASGRSRRSAVIPAPRPGARPAPSRRSRSPPADRPRLRSDRSPRARR